MSHLVISSLLLLASFRKIINPSFRETCHKEAHKFSSNPPTNHATTQQNLSAHRLGAFINSPPSTVVPSRQTTQHIESAHKARVIEKLEEIQPRLP